MTRKIVSFILILAMIVPVFAFDAVGAESAYENASSPKTYLNSDGRRGIYPFFYPGSEVAEWSTLAGEIKPRIHLKREQGSTPSRTPYFEFDFNTVDKNIQSYVYEINVYPAKHTGINGYRVSLFNVYDKSNPTLNDTPLMMDNNRLLYGDTVIATVAEGGWTRVSCVVDLADGTFDAYVNGEIKKSGITLRERIVPKRVRVAINYGYTETEYYFDNIRLYEGDALSDNLPSMVSFKETKEDVSAILSDSSVFMTNIDNLYIHGNKTTYTANGYKKFENNNIFYVSADCAEDIFSCDVSSLTNTLTDSDGTVYVPLKSTAEKCGKYVYEDKRGWICVSGTDLGLVNSDMTVSETEQSDLIDRYMHFDRPSGDNIMSMLFEHSGGSHPRIFTTAEDVGQLKRDILSNNFKQTGASETIRQANEILSKDVVTYEKTDGLRLFIPCLTVRNYLVTLTTAYLITEDEAAKQSYFDRIWAELQNVCITWKDWNVERHYLDSGKLLPGIALAYDVCYDELGSEKRKIIRDAVQSKFMYYACASYAGDTNNYNIGKNPINWGAVCNGGALLVCLATMDDPEASEEYKMYAKFIAEEALYGLEYPACATFPDGAWDEGLSYYGYVVEYLSWSANALRNSCGSDFGIMSYPGVAELPRYAMYIQSLKNGFFPYSDGATDSAENFIPSELFLIARLLGDQELNDMLYHIKFAILDETIYTTQFIRDFLFYTPGDANDVYTSYPYDSTFGKVEIGVMKGGWDVNDTYFASLGGVTDSSSHFDKGSFIFETLGERWSEDLGKDDYNIEGGYYGELGYTIYRKRAEGHNTLVFNPDEAPGQVPNTTARITDTAYGRNEACTVYDLTDTYSDNCTEAKRGFLLGDGRKTLLIQDEFTLREDNSEVYWFMHTKANITTVDADTVTLSKNGKTVKVDFLTNLDSFTISPMAAEPLPTTPERPGQNANEGISKICFKGTGSGAAYITAKITPVADGASYTDISYVPINEWKIDEYPENGSANTTTNSHTLDFENYKEAVYLNKNGSVTYPDNYYSRSEADKDLLPVANICSDMFTNGTLSIERSESDDGHGKYLTMRRLGGTLYQNYGYFMIPANTENGEIVGKKHGELIFEFDLRYMHNWKFALYLTPVSASGTDGSTAAIIGENSKIGAIYIGDDVSEKWIHVKLKYDLDNQTFSGTVGDYYIGKTAFSLNSADPSLEYFKLDVTMSGEGRYASFDNFTTSYVPYYDNHISLKDGTAKAKFVVDRPDVTDAVCYLAAYSGNALKGIVIKPIEIVADAVVYDSEELELPGEYSEIRCFVFDSDLKPIIKPIEN